MAEDLGESKATQQQTFVKKNKLSVSEPKIKQKQSLILDVPVIKPPINVDRNGENDGKEGWKTSLKVTKYTSEKKPTKGFYRNFSGSLKTTESPKAQFIRHSES